MPSHSQCRLSAQADERCKRHHGRREHCPIVHSDELEHARTYIETQPNDNERRKTKGAGDTKNVGDIAFFEVGLTWWFRIVSLSRVNCRHCICH